MVDSVPVAGPPGGGVPYVCPRCWGALLGDRTGLACRHCGVVYPYLDTAWVDFAGAAGFDDWWMQSNALRERWLAEAAPKEERYQVGVARHFVLPLLARLGLPPGSSVLAAACGLAADVEVLNDHGYPTWGIDLGSRTVRWARRRHRERLARADLFQLPFPDGSFDLVTALNVLEHIGTVGDTTDVTPDYEQQRLEAVRSLLRVVKPGGYLVLSGVNRRFPVDPFHRQRHRFLRLHSPFEPFSLSFGDQARLCLATGYADWVRPLPLRGFFSFTNLRQHRPLRPLLRLMHWSFGAFPAEVYGSWLSFFSIVLVHRRVAPLGATRSTPYPEA